MDTVTIENLRKRREITQKDLSERVGMTTTGYQKMIRTGDVKVSVLEKLAQALGVDIQTFFGVQSGSVQIATTNVVLQLESTDVLMIDLKNKKLEIIKK